MNSTRASLHGPPPFDLTSLGEETRIGKRVRIFAHRIMMGPGVTLGDDVVLVGDEIVLEKGTIIGRNSDLRAAHIQIGANSEIGSDVRVLVADSFSVGVAARISSKVKIVCRDFQAGRLLYLGDSLEVGYGGTTTSTATMHIGNRVALGQHSILNANYPIEIGNDVGTGSYLAIWTHGYHFGHGPLRGYSPAYAPVRIGRNVWLGFHVTLLPGVTLGDNSVVAAGSVVTKPMPANALIGGVPATVRKELIEKEADEPLARSIVGNLLRVWQRELVWKGCQIVASDLEGSCPQTTVARGDGSERTRVVALGSSDLPPTPSQGELLVLVVFEDRQMSEGRLVIGDQLAEADTILDLRAGRQFGQRTPLVEDLRDQFRRHAMPCGDDLCFTMIEPLPFARLRNLGNE